MKNIRDILNSSVSSPDHGSPMSSTDLFRIAAPAAMTIDRVVTPIWYVIGVIGNPISMKIWLSKQVRKSNSSAIYIGCIAVVHFTFMWLHLLLELHIAWGISTFNKPTLCEIFNFMYITPQYLSPLLILGFTVERYIAVCLPFKKETFCTVERARIVVFLLTTFSIFFGSVQAYIWSYDDERQMCYYRKGAKGFYEIWTWISEILIFAVVPLAVLTFNILVIREIKCLTKRASFQMHRESNGPRSANHTSTVTLLCVSFYLICTLLPATIVYAMQSVVPTGDPDIPVEKWSSDPQWQIYLTYFTIRKIVEEICFSNYACYVFIYYIAGSYFRNEVHKMVLFRFLRSDKRTTCSISKTMNNEQFTLVTTNRQHETIASATLL